MRKGDDDLSIGSYFYAELCSRTLLKVKNEKQDSKGQVQKTFKKKIKEKKEDQKRNLHAKHLLPISKTKKRLEKA